jgi:N-acetylglucosamine-6-sulfatase
MASLVRLSPSLLVSALLGALALALDHGRGAGLSQAALDTTGRLYFLMLVGGPLLIYPFALRDGENLRVRLALSLLPGFLWWITEIGVRLRWHTLAESLWLVMSPVNAAHLWLSLLAAGLAHLGYRAVEQLGGGAPLRVGVRPVSLSLLFLLGPPIAIIGGVHPYLQGYRALFQSDLLPLPGRLPGPLDAAELVYTVGKPAPRPNVIFILSDDHRFDFAGFESHPFVETPSLDRLAREGTRFDRAFVTSSLCSPSRASFLTGTTPHRHGVWNNFTPWSNENRTFLEYLKMVGYRTAFIGKWHMPGGQPDLRGVDRFVTFTNMGGQGVYENCPLVVDGRDEPSRKRYIAEELTDRALEWIEANREAPFALHLSHKSVHADFTPDAPERGRHAERQVALPPGAHPWTHLTNGQYTHLNFTPLDDAIRRYAEAIASMDRQIGRVLDYLDANGLAENTIIIYTSDNGYQWGEHQLVDKRWAYEESIRIPFLMRYPALGHGEGVRVQRMVTNLDVAPTLLALAGIAPPEWMQGRSLLPLLGEANPPWRDAVLYSYYFEPPYPTPTMHAVRTERYKYIAYEGLPPELFDLEADPSEQVNRAGDPAMAAIRTRLESRLANLRAAIEN